ncbi:peptidyl-Lys metalloendopeptidase [Flagelloscypha sp. PMI_526]|nr:peptidyl-Lys metalloendopeptidase [Flagelloscypha sp. PMI_526]
MLFHGVVFAWLAFCFGLVFATREITIELTGPKSLDGKQNLTVTASIKNTGHLKLKILKDPRGLLSTVATNKFNVSHQDGLVPFVGAVAKYVPANIIKSKDPSLFTFLEPGECIYVKHNLNEAYNFTAVNFSHPGSTNLTITPIALDFLIAHDTAKEPIVIRSLRSIRDILRISPSRTWFPIVFLPFFRGHEKYVGCSASQQSLINNAAAGATTLASFANSYISSTTTGTPRYTTWFGQYDSGRRETVRSHFSSIRGNDFLGFTYDCTCSDPGVYAKVNPSVFGYINICPVFWTAPASGTDSKAGTLIHESSHFLNNGGTQDYRYGQISAQSLATSDPFEAVMNADSHEYFAENTPQLS